MQKALEQAQHAAEADEVPVGAVVVKDGQIISRTHNRSIQNHDPCAHAEILALREAASSLGNYRLPGCCLYVTLEPCSMCAGAMIHARIDNLIFGAYDPKAGAVTSVYQLLDSNKKQHQVDWEGGVLKPDCSSLITQFFKQKRLQSRNMR